MEDLRDILFKCGDYAKKKAYIDTMSTDALLKIDGGIVKDIIKHTNPVSNSVRIRREFTPERFWNSYVEEFFIINGDVYVMLYVQNTKTDTSKSEKFHVFFSKRNYVSSNNNLNVTISYNAEEKAYAMRSLLNTFIYDLYCDEAQKEKLFAKLTHYTITNEVYNHFYREFDLQHKELSKYSNRDCAVKRIGYYHGKEKVEEYIKEHCLELDGKSNEELIEIYKGVFKKAFNEFDKNFDFDEWRKNTTFWF
jgi:hypothetical protein